MSLTTIQKILLATGAVLSIGFLLLKSESYIRDKGVIRKLQKSEVNYQEPYFVDMTGLFYKCEDCINYIKPSIDDTLPACTIVEGAISPKAGCNRWAGLRAYRQSDQLRKVSNDPNEIALKFLTNGKVF